jgi:hypothetical protein
MRILSSLVLAVSLLGGGIAAADEGYYRYRAPVVERMVPRAELRVAARYPMAAPPLAPIEVRAPRPGYVWIPGEYSWANGQYVFVPGHYRRARAGWHWAPATWHRHGHVFVKLGGGWRRG